MRTAVRPLAVGPRPDHPDTLTAASTLTLALFSVGEVEGARALGEDTLRRCRGVLGPDHPTTLDAAAALTVALIGLAEAEPTRALGEDTLRRCRRVFGPDHPIALYLTQAASSGHPILGSDTAADPQVGRCELSMHRQGAAAFAVRVLRGRQGQLVEAGRMRLTRA